MQRLPGKNVYNGQSLLSEASKKPLMSLDTRFIMVVSKLNVTFNKI